MVVTGAIGLATGGSASGATDPGVGSSYAQGFQVTPHEGSLAVGAVFDEALAGHTDQVARAQSQGLDLGAVGTSIKGYNCGQPPSALANYVPSPLEAETPTNGGTDQATAGPSPSQNNSDGSVEQVLANDTPYGEADTTLAGPIAGPNNFIVISGVASKAWSGLVNGTRDAGATVDIGYVSIAGVVTLSHLHWSADYPDGKQPTSSFAIGQATIDGTAVPTGDPSQVINAVNQALNSIGVVLSYPTATNASGIQFESPLQIEVVPNSTRNGVTDPVISGAVEPNYYPIANGLENGFANTSAPYNSLAPVEQQDPTGQLEQALCQSDTPITVLDITMASFTAAGYFNIALGGVNASSGPMPTNPYNLAMFNFGSLSSNSDQLSSGTAGLTGTPGTPAIAGTPGQTLSGSSSPAGQGSTKTQTQRVVPASVTAPAAGPLLGIGLGILGFLALLAEADRRMIRRTLNTATFEE
jgi:hypothetical protein